MINMKKYLVWLSAFSAFILGISSCKPSMNNQPPAAVPVNLYKVQAEKASYSDVYPGNVIALNEVELRSEVNGFITGIYFEEGQPVKKGQKLYVIEQNKYAAAYDQAQAALNIANANMEKAKKDAERYHNLGAQGMTSQQRIEYSETDFENAKMQVSSAQA